MLLKIYGNLKYILCAITLVIIGVGFYFYGIDRSKDSNVVELIITHPTLQDVEFNVPIEYLGPRFLDMSEKNIKGGRQEKFLVQFLYPSMQAVSTELDKIEQNELEVYVLVATSIKQTSRVTIIRKSEQEFSKYKPTAEMCDLVKFEEIPDRYIDHTLYHYFDEDDPSDDVHIDCSSRACRLSAAFASGISEGVYYSIALNGLPVEKICEWRPILSSTKELIWNFNVK